jgi:hypothetical protein
MGSVGQPTQPFRKDKAAMKPTQNPTTAPEPDPMRPSALLRGAALYLFWHGWTQHEFYDMTAKTNKFFPAACASGAIMTSATGKTLSAGMCTLDSDHNTDIAAVRKAMRVFVDFIDGGPIVAEPLPTSSIDIIGDWNDYDGRTVGEVIEALTDAADDWDSKHPTGGAR